MTSDTQREAMAVLAEVWKLSPDVRLGQLMAHLGFLGETYVGKGLGYIDDDELVAILYRHRSELTARLQGVPTEQAAGINVSISGSPITPDAFSNG
jgi:hypothetical protein